MTKLVATDLHLRGFHPLWPFVPKEFDLCLLSIGFGPQHHIYYFFQNNIRFDHGSFSLAVTKEIAVAFFSTTYLNAFVQWVPFLKRGFVRFLDVQWIPIRGS